MHGWLGPAPARYYHPTGKQALFHRSTADEVLFGGAAGGGKTAALAMEACIRCLSTPGVQMYLFRRTYRELMDTLVLQSRRFCLCVIKKQ